MLTALLVLVFALGQWVVPQLPRLLGFGQEIARVAGAPAPETPAGPAFSIWLVIFAGTTLYAARQLRPRHRDTQVYLSIRGPALLAVALACAWMAWAQFVGNGRVLVGIIVAYLLSAIVVFQRLLAMRASLDRFDMFVTLPSFGLLVGWLSAAAWLNTVSWLKLERFIQASPTLIAAATLLAIGLTAIVLLRCFSSPVSVAAAQVWALGWVAYANIALRENREIATIAIGLVLIIVALVLWDRRPVRQTDRIYR
jgi:FtsH-binding integral membrane protein